MSQIAANDIKKRGVTALEDAVSKDGEALITVRGKDRFVVMTVEKYDALREIELAQAVKEAQADYETGRVLDKSVEDHMKRLDDEI